MTDQQTYIRLFGLCGCVHLIKVLYACIGLLYVMLPFHFFIYFGLFVAGIAAIIHLFIKYVW